MENNREINALLNLIDDPDEEVYLTVENRLMSYGNPVIPQLEHLWENTLSEAVQERIEMIIHRIHFIDLKNELIQWRDGDPDLFHGALLVAKYQYPELQTVKALQDVEKMRRNLWLELNNSMTPIEEVKIFESILYNYYKLQGSEVNYSKCEDFAIHKVIERKKGNAITNGILYIVLAQMLDLPIKAIRIPKQFVLGYFSMSALFNESFDDGNAAGKIKFFIDPNTGTAFSHKDVDHYFKRINVPPVNSYFKPMTNSGIIKTLIEQYAKCFESPELTYKKNELNELAELIDD
ncbi:MAG: transglutaminase-like domain-containing protein [Chitinophagaceae bacterium]|jgi:hypothetical protein|nr:transglutaminase-like domain-containing protein [Chitinophagaceae bacterium]